MTGPRDAAHQLGDCCTWCGHRPHRTTCNGRIKVATAPAGGPGRTTPTGLVDCPCARERVTHQ